MGEVRQMPAGRAGGEVGINGWRPFVTKALAERLGVLADVVVDEALVDSGLDEGRLGLRQFNLFLAALYLRLPDDMDRRAIVSGLQAAVLDRLFTSLRRDLDTRLDAAR